MLFSQRMNMWSGKMKQRAEQVLQQFGSVDEMIAYIDNMTCSYQINKNVTVKFDNTYYVCYNKYGVSIYRRDDILYCWQHSGSQGSHVGIMTKDGVVGGAVNPGILSLTDTYHLFCKFLPHIEQVAYCPCSFEKRGIKNIKVQDGRFTYYKKYKPLFKKEEREKIYYETDITNLIWCYQEYDINTDSPNTYHVRLAFRDGKKIQFDISFSTDSIFSGCAEGFELILNLKKNVPHLLYGDNEEYRKLFFMNPEELFVLAKQKCNM